MKTICIGRGTQVLLMLTGIGLIAAVVASQLPEIRRYLKIEAM